MPEQDFMQKAEKAMAQIARGAFLTVRAGDALNTMTIGWGQIGIIWSMPIFTVMVRDSRHTFGLMEQSPDFTVTAPWENLSEALAFCGSKSGRDVDKFSALGLTVQEARQTQSPVILCSGMHYECRIVYKQPLNPDRFLDQRLPKAYPNRDYHTLYYGEILERYETR